MRTATHSNLRWLARLANADRFDALKWDQVFYLLGRLTLRVVFASSDSIKANVCQ